MYGAAQVTLFTEKDKRFIFQNEVAAGESEEAKFRNGVLSMLAEQNELLRSLTKSLEDISSKVNTAHQQTQNDDD